MAEAFAQAGLPIPKFEERSGGICVELMNAPLKERRVAGEMSGSRREGAAEKRGEKRGERLSGNRRKILNAMRSDPTVSQASLVEIVGIGSTNIEKNIRYLKDQGWIRRVGPAKGGRWEVLK